MNFKNTTHLDSRKLEDMMRAAISGWPCDGLMVRIRYSRGAEFSGSCYYQSNRIFVNLGRDNRYPYEIRTHIARPQSNRKYWWRELYGVEASNAAELVLFVFLHEFYHWLVKKARRNIRQKEARCDRFATRVLVDRYGAEVRDSSGRTIERSMWDFQDLDGFVAAARFPAQRKAGRPTLRAACQPFSRARGKICCPPGLICNPPESIMIAKRDPAGVGLFTRSISLRHSEIGDRLCGLWLG